MLNRYLQLFSPDPLSQSLKVYISANGFFRALGIVRGILLIWLIAQAEFGVYQLGLLLANVLLPLLSFGLYEGVWRFVPEFETKGQLRGFIVYASMLVGGITLGTCGILFLLSPFLGPTLVGSLSALGEKSADAFAELDISTALTRMAVLCVLVLALYHTLLAILRGRRMFRALSLMELTANCLFTVLAVVAALAGRGTGMLLLSLYAISSLFCIVIFGGPMLWQIWCEVDQRGSVDGPQSTQRLVRYSLWAGGGAFFWQMLMLYPAWHLNRVHGEEVFAAFSGIRVLTQVGFLACTAMSVAVISSATKLWEAQGREAALEQLNLASKGSILAVLIGCLLIAVFKGVLIFLFRSDYRGGEQAIPPLLLFYMLAGALSFVTIRFNLVQKSRLTFTSWLVGCCVAVVASFCLITSTDHQQALLMASWASVAGVTASLLATLVILKQQQLLPDRGTLILLAAVYLLVAKWPFLIAGTMAIVLISLSSSLIFTKEQRNQLLQLVGKWLGLRYPLGNE